MANESVPNQKKLVPTSFSIKPVRRSAIEVLMHGVTYLYETNESFEKLEAFREGEAGERVELVRQGSEIGISLWHHSGHTATFTSHIDGDQISTTVDLGGQAHVVQSDLRTHGLELARALRDRKGPRMPYVRWFSKEFALNIEFRQALKSQELISSNGVTGAFCIALCTCCLVLVPDPIPGDELPCCVGCAHCIVGS